MNGPAPRPAAVLGQSGRPADAFVGRRDELAAISSYVDAIVSGRPWVIWVEGDAGSGKTALVRQAVSRLSSEVRVLQATADELSADVEFAVVEQLAAIRGRSGFAPASSSSLISERPKTAGRLSSWWRTCTGPTPRRVRRC